MDRTGVFDTTEKAYLLVSRPARTPTRGEEDPGPRRRLCRVGDEKRDGLRRPVLLRTHPRHLSRPNPHLWSLPRRLESESHPRTRSSPVLSLFVPQAYDNLRKYCFPRPAGGPSPLANYCGALDTHPHGESWSGEDPRTSRRHFLPAKGRKSVQGGSLPNQATTLRTS